MTYQATRNGRRFQRKLKAGAPLAGYESEHDTIPANSAKTRPNFMRYIKLPKNQRRPVHSFLHAS
jgi:hypothetical protein